MTGKMDRKGGEGFLTTCLSGQALMVLQNLPPEKRLSCPDLVQDLGMQFGASHQSEVAKAHLRARRKGKEENPAGLEEDPWKLVLLAYPDTTEAFHDTLAMDPFTDFHLDLDLQIKISERHSKPVEFAMEL